jgi:heat shock protein HtpX
LPLAKLMAEEHDTFRHLEHANRRKTVQLVVTFILIYAVSGFVLDLLFRTLRIVDHRMTGFPWLTIGAVAIASTQALWAYYLGSSAVIRAVQADDLTPSSVKEQAVLDVVSEMALAARMPMPRVCLMEDPAPNAFASGRDPGHSVICVTRGLVDQLDREELQGVIAHEIAHIRGHDTRVTQMAVVMVGGFGLLSGFAMKTAVAIRDASIPFVGILLIPIFILGGVGWIFSKMVSIALSRQREYLADAAAVEFTRNPTALIRALGHIAQIESPLKTSLRGVAPLFIVDPFECGGTNWANYLDEVARIESQQDLPKEQRDAQAAAYVVKGMPQISFRVGLSSHPPIRDRIVRLRALLHEPSDVPEETLTDVQTRRRAAARIVTETTQNNPAMAAALIGSIIGANPGELLRRELGENSPLSALIPALPSEQEQTYADPAEQAAYKKLYEYNLGFTGDKAGLSAGPAPNLGSPLAGLEAVRRMDPTQLQAILAAGMAAGARKRPAATSEGVDGQLRPAKKPHYVFWFVIILSAAAIIAAQAIK